MKIFIPYTKFLSIQAQHLYMDDCEPEYIDVSGDPHLYFEVMKEIWSLKEDFILLEHDIIPWPGALKTFEECLEHWCAFKYYYPPSGHLVIANGCVRFRKEIMELIPDLFDLIEKNNEEFFVRSEDPKDWKALDGRMGAILTNKLNNFVHVHHPAVVHLKEAISGKLVSENDVS